MTGIRMKKYLLHIACSFLFIVVVSCENEQRPEPIEPDLPEVISFSEHIIPIFNGESVGRDLTGRGKACIDCHAGKTPPNLSEESAYLELTGGGYIDVADPENSKLYEEVKDGSMSKYSNNVDVEYILEWINQGALDN